METANPIPSSELQGRLSPENSDFDQKARALYEKYGLFDAHPQIDKAIAETKRFAEKHELSREFLDDETNMALLLGGIQKRMESQDPNYQKRIDLFLARLIAPAAKGTIDADELFGKHPDRAGLEAEEGKQYVLSKTDQEATKAFTEKYAKELEECREIWRQRGLDLDIQVYIVNDDRRTFLKNLRSAGYILHPDRTKIGTAEFKPTIEMVLLKGESADKEAMVRHELYHVKDFFVLVRRGYQSQILESLDELHTEYAAGNFDEHFSDRGFDDDRYAAYFSLKEFWAKFAYTSGVDFGVLSDRKATEEAIIRQFGFSGFVDFALMSAHASGKGSVFDTFYMDPNRPVMSMMIEGQKIKLRRALKSGEVKKVMEETSVHTSRLAELMTPQSGNDLSPRHHGVYDFIPSKFGKVYAARPVDSTTWSSVVDNEDARDTITSFVRGLAFMELKVQNEVFGYEELIETTRGSLAKVPFGRKRDFVPDAYVEKYREDVQERGSDMDAFYQDKIRSLYHQLIQDTEGNDFLPALNNQEVRQMIFSPFSQELDIIAQYCVDNKDPRYTQWFIDGIYGYVVATELREMSVDYLIQKFPQIKDQLEEKRRTFDARTVANKGFM